MESRIIGEKMNKGELDRLNTTVLAYMGDAVYEEAIRKHIVSSGKVDVNILHKLSTRYVSARAQARIIKSLFDELDEEEKKLVKRARNRKYTTKAKNADPMTYKWATALEALVGYLYLNEDVQRLQWILMKSIEIIEKEVE